MSREWYNAIALRNNGYRTDAKYTREGISGEEEFEKMLISNSTFPPSNQPQSLM